ncbi:hypothetical protein ASPWEDRAFT_43896 [Aspergillus wentii DTO 134E9]|uniref:J domain-containing protein n=1 Tax=Aspergillus wentii DTO 134E9 TaxID=1073089 RepID=A0A1L9RAI2_ASPWE|nr:uncharacterized protein ASPWEDRAFT_43896 [Aspergillus wentii DTO 134E9]KAI9934469.1 hypothetical protein MW887_000083 [Aspergillus wentii]OJJ31883.1 hypothetical protein ASPWEDRAFT_43896 [Aspergillus wentii DTO 134E9]
MTTPFRSQRLVQRLSLSGTSRPTTTRLQPFPSSVSTNQRAPTPSTQCQYRWSSTIPTRPGQTPLHPQQTRHYASESTTGNTPDITNYYTIFPQTIPSGPPPASPFDIPLGDLRREFLQLQNVTHPDKYPTGAAKQRAEALSARINEAYRTLFDPLNRAQYLLRELHGIDVTAEDGAAKHALDPETLMEVMEVQETIEEVGAEPEGGETIAKMKKENEVRVTECVKALGEAFNSGDIEAARRECVRLRFWYSVGEGLKEWEPGMIEIRLVH